MLLKTASYKSVQRDRNKSIFGDKVKTMEREDLIKRISVDPNICFGKPCIRGTRLWVSLILDNLAEGVTEEKLLEEYPKLTHEDVLAAIAYGAEMSRERYVLLPVEKSA